MKTKTLLWIGAALLAAFFLYWWLRPAESMDRDISTRAFVGSFEDVVSSSGELLALNSEDIVAPDGLQRYGLYDVKIAKLVPEGTVVDSGDFVAELDKSPLSSKLNETFNELEKAKSQFTQVRLDTTLELREKRNELETKEFDLRQKRIEIEQSKYEPPATIQRLKLDLEKMEQGLEQSRENYLIKRKQAAAKIREAAATLSQAQSRFEELQALQKEFRITAPMKGMVIYYRSWRGTPRKEGSTISPWNRSVATLPDLSQMQSKTYINEVDIRKVKVGQSVKITLDAFPEVSLGGTVSSVANVGENRENSDSKVFEVMIEVFESDSSYRPGMTTGNQIRTYHEENLLQIPLEAVFSNEQESFVYLRRGAGIEKQEVRLGRSNDEFSVVLAGLSEGDEIFLTEPIAAQELPVITLAEAQ